MQRRQAPVLESAGKMFREMTPDQWANTPKIWAMFRGAAGERRMDQLRSDPNAEPEGFECVSLKTLMSACDMVCGDPRVEESESIFTCVRRGPGSILQMTRVPRADAAKMQMMWSGIGLGSCWLGMEVVIKLRPEQGGIVRWSGGWEGYRFTRKGMIQSLVEWLDSGMVGTKLDYLVWIGRLESRDDPAGAKSYRIPGQQRWRGRDDLRGHFGVFFSAAVHAGILRYRREDKRSLLTKGPNFEAFKEKRLVYSRTAKSRFELTVTFLQDDWVALHCPDFNDESVSYRCDGLAGLGQALDELLGRLSKNI